MSELRKAVEEEELRALRRQYGEFPVEVAELEVGAYFFESAKTPLGKTRRAEILAVVVAPDGRVLVHTKHFYPRGTFRLLTGGIHVGEPVEEALARELREETGLRAQDRCLLGVLRYRIVHQEHALDFASYAYVVKVATTRVAPEDDEEEISQFRWVPFAELSHVREGLLQVPPEWQDWGRFRALGHAFVMRYRTRCL